MDKLSCAILNTLFENGCNSRLKAMSIQDIEKNMIVKQITIYKRLFQLVSLGYVQLGFKDCRQNTYYITQEGIQKLEEELK